MLMENNIRSATDDNYSVFQRVTLPIVISGLCKMGCADLLAIHAWWFGALTLRRPC